MSVPTQKYKPVRQIGIWRKKSQGRPHIGIYTLQKGSFSTILHQTPTAGVSLAVGVVAYLAKKMFWSALQFWQKDSAKTVQIPM